MTDPDPADLWQVDHPIKTKAFRDRCLRGNYLRLESLNDNASGRLRIPGTGHKQQTDAKNADGVSDDGRQKSS